MSQFFNYVPWNFRSQKLEAMLTPIIEADNSITLEGMKCLKIKVIRDLLQKLFNFPSNFNHSKSAPTGISTFKVKKNDVKDNSRRYQPRRQQSIAENFPKKQGQFRRQKSIVQNLQAQNHSHRQQNLVKNQRNQPRRQQQQEETVL